MSNKSLLIHDNRNRWEHKFQDSMAARVLKHNKIDSDLWCCFSHRLGFSKYTFPGPGMLYYSLAAGRVYYGFDTAAR